MYQLPRNLFAPYCTQFDPNLSQPEFLVDKFQHDARKCKQARSVNSRADRLLPATRLLLLVVAKPPKLRKRVLPSDNEPLKVSEKSKKYHFNPVVILDSESEPPAKLPPAIRWSSCPVRLLHLYTRLCWSRVGNICPPVLHCSLCSKLPILVNISTPHPFVYIFKYSGTSSTP